MKKRIGILVHRSLPAPRLRDACRLLERMEVGYEVEVASAAVDPAGIGRWVEAFAQSGGEAVVVYGDSGGTLANLAAAYSQLPIISASLLTPFPAQGMPVASAPVRPDGSTAVVTSGQAGDAVRFALRVLAIADGDLRQRLEADHRQAIERLHEQGRLFRQELEGTAPKRDSTEGKVSPDRPGDVPRSEAVPLSPNDDAMVEEFARSLRSRLKTEHGPPPSVGGVQALDYSMVLREIISEARDLAVRRPSRLIGPVHFLAAIVRMPQAAANRALREAEANFVRLGFALETLLGPESSDDDAPLSFGLDPDGETMLAAAKLVAREAGRTCLTTVDILLAIGLGEDRHLAEALDEAGVEVERLHDILHRPEIAGAECEELDASRKDRLPKTGTPTAVDHEALQKMQHRLYGGEPMRAGTSSASDVIDIQRDEGSDFPAPVEPAATPEALPPSGSPRIVRVDPENPDLEVVEEASDALLDGGVVALPTDTMFALLADATNHAAVGRLVETVGRSPQRPIGVFVHSVAVVKQIARNIPAGVEEMLDELWPGPLTVVFERHPARFKQLGEEATIGIRLPDHYLTLAILSMLGRPMAAVAAPAGVGDAPVDAHEIAGLYEGDLKLVLDARETPRRVQPTILSVVGGQFRILRPGPVSRERIERALGQPVTEE